MKITNTLSRTIASLVSYCKLTEVLIPVTFIQEVYQLRFWLGNWLS